MKENPQIIISVPHGYCGIEGEKLIIQEKDDLGRFDFRKKYFDRVCDLTAKSFSTILASELEKSLRNETNEKIMKTEIFLIQSNVFRPHTDHNRRKGRDSRFRDILESILKNTSEYSIHLDVHSAPDDILKRIGYTENDYDLFAVDLSSCPDDDAFNIGMVEYLEAESHKIYNLSVGNFIDISYISNYKYNLKNVSLIDVNENLSMEKLINLANSLAKYLISTLNDIYEIIEIENK